MGLGHIQKYDALRDEGILMTDSMTDCMMGRWHDSMVMVATMLMATRSCNCKRFCDRES